MTRPIDPTAILCKDGRSFSVDRKCGRVTVFASFRDRLAVDAGLARFTTFHEPGDACAEHAGMPVEVVREYARLHGGVAQAGEQAIALLKELAGETAAPPEPAPVAEAPPTDSPARPSRTQALMAAGTHDFLGRPLPPGLPVDFLTPVVIEARRVVAEVERPLKPVLGYEGVSPLQAALEWRAEQASSAASRLALLEGAQYVRHPLKTEAIDLRKRLAKAEEKAKAELAKEA